VLVLREALRAVVAMDYLISGIATVGLFVYLLYALVRPERF
jgi:K+-transporting ATPase KdpF subunit